MSMYDIPLTTPALYFDDYTAALACLSYDQSHSTVPKSIQAMLDTGEFDNAAYNGLLPDDVDYSVDALQNILGDLFTASGFTGDISSMFPEDTAKPIDETLDDDCIAYLLPNRQPSLFKAAYPDKNALRDEFKTRLADAGITMPDNFDWWAYIVDITGTVFS